MEELARITVEVPKSLKMETQIKAIENDTDLKNYVTEALIAYNKQPKEKAENKTELEIN